LSKTTEKLILDRLDTITRILALQVGADKSLTDRVYLLTLSGLDNATMAEVLNTSPAAVRALKSDIRKALKKRK